MELSVDWTKIKDGFRGFERLAFAFVQEIYPNTEWQRTAETRDGNKDAVALIFGYQPFADLQEQWWMEAKYSTKTEIISRYRLDATIVSAVLKGSVSKIIFVTNILISTKTILDIRTALQNTINCNEVIFSTRHTLEFWLARNPNLYHDFFDVPKKFKDTPIKLPDFFITQELNFYTEETSRFTFKEPVRSIYIGKNYIGYFSVFSSKKREITIKAPLDYKGLNLLSKKKLILESGENQIKVRFRIEKKLNNENHRYAIPTFLIDSTKVHPLRPIFPTENENIALSIPSQNKILDEIIKNIKTFKKKNQIEICTIEGISGVGKSYIINKLITSDIIEDVEDVFFLSFTHSMERNAELFIDLIFFILFPFLPSDQITIEYFEAINDKQISKELLQILKSKGDIEELVTNLIRYSEEDKLLPQNISLNRRFVFIDDLQKLNPHISGCLLSLVISLQKRSLPVFVLLSFQPSFINRGDSFNFLLENCVIRRYYYEININDIIDCLSLDKLPQKKQLSNWLKATNFNIIELLVFSRYIWDQQQSINNFEELLLLSKTFQRSGILENYILQKFKDLFSTHPETKELCNLIYWSPEPYCLQENSERHQVAEIIVASGLARYNNDDALVAQHDIYTECYQLHYAPKTYDEIELVPNHPTKIYSALVNDFKKSKLNKSIKLIQELTSSRHFHTVLYILHKIFETSIKDELKTKLDEKQYYELFLMYALAANQQSLTVNCKKLFDDIILEITSNKNKEIQYICLRALWDSALLYYEDLDYQTSLKKLNLMFKVIKELQVQQFLPKENVKCLHYHDAMVADTLIKANLNKQTDKLFETRSNEMKINGFHYRYLSFSVRYALTLSHTNISKSLSILDNCKVQLKERYGNNDKHYNWCGFHISFFKAAFEKRQELINDALKYHEKMKKDHYNNYRHRLSAIAIYFFSIGDEINGSKYLLKDTIFSKDLCTRQKAFSYIALCMNEIYNNNFDLATNYLKDSFVLLQHLQSYGALIKHNIDVLENNLYSNEHIEYWFGSKFRNDTFYLDPRWSW